VHVLDSRRQIIKKGLLGAAGLTVALAAVKFALIKAECLPILTFPHPLLRQPAQSISAIDETIVRTAKQMIALLRTRAMVEFFLKGSLPKGLSAPQIGVSKRLTVCGLQGELKVLVNPVIIEKKGTYDNREYCLSLPHHQTRTIQRSQYVRLHYQDMGGMQHTLVAANSDAGLLEHETDHLNGILYIDHQSSV